MFMTRRHDSFSVRFDNLYASDTLNRLCSPAPPKGSHALGVVVRAAKEFEKETSAVIRYWCPNAKAEKQPLGQLATILRRNAVKSSHPNPQALLDLAGVMAKTNKSWVQLKHRDDPPLPELIGATKLILSGFELLDVSGPPY